MPGHHVAQLNVGTTVEPVTSARLDGFFELMEPVNALADAAPGFVWRLPPGDAEADAYLRARGDRLIINLSTWTSLGTLRDFVYAGAHAAAMRRRREWFEPVQEAFTVLWWVPAGHRPTVAEADGRLTRLRAEGPGPDAFTFQRPSPAPAD